MKMNFWKTNKDSSKEVKKSQGNGTTEMVFIMDKSGSMSGLENDTIGGFNSMIERQKEQEGQVYVSMVLFNHMCEVVHDRVALKDVQPMTRANYCVDGCTALLDAIGGAIHHIGNIHKYARREDVPEHTLFVITTDGMENASKKYNLAQIRDMIERQKNKYGWEFLFMGANIDAIETARSFGIPESRAVNYHADGEGTRNVYETVAEAACYVRAHKPLDAGWKKKIEADYEGRASHRR